MDNDNYNHIFHATNNRLAEMLEIYCQWQKCTPPCGEPGINPPFSKEEMETIISEAARRLRIPP